MVGAVRLLGTGMDLSTLDSSGDYRGRDRWLNVEELLRALVAEGHIYAPQAALTGHLVLTTLHTNDAVGSITRFLDLKVQPYLMRSALIGVAAQRLVRTLCPHCKAPAATSPDEWNNLVAPFDLPEPGQVFIARGCDECRHTGYLGRIGIFEVMRLSSALMGHITESPELGPLRKSAMREGMRSLRASGAEKVKAGLTSVAEVLAVVQS